MKENDDVIKQSLYIADEMANSNVSTDDIVKRSFYLTSQFAEVRPDSSLSNNGFKIALSLFAYLSNYRIYLPEALKIKSLEEINDEISKIPLEYSLTKSQFMDITGVTSTNFSREIKAVRKELAGKIINTPHPDDTDEDSGVSIPWFSRISYSAKKGILNFELNKYAVEKLVAFYKYTKIDPKYLQPLKSQYSSYTYIFLKIIKDISYRERLTSQIIGLEELKERLGLKGKYKVINMFEEKVLEVVKKEINEKTDFIYDYELIKEGRAYTYIKLLFDYKKKHIEEFKELSINDFDNIEVMFDEDDSPFEKILISWGIRAKKIVEIENEYSFDVIGKSIDIVQQQIDSGKIEDLSKIGGYFLTVLDNKNKEYEFKEKQQIKEKEALILRNQEKDLGEYYDNIRRFFIDNENEIKNFLIAGLENNKYPLEENIKHSLKDIILDLDKFKDFRPRLPIFFEGYWDEQRQAVVNPNLYTLLIYIKSFMDN